MSAVNSFQLDLIIINISLRLATNLVTAHSLMMAVPAQAASIHNTMKLAQHRSINGAQSSEMLIKPWRICATIGKSIARTRTVQARCTLSFMKTDSWEISRPKCGDSMKKWMCQATEFVFSKKMETSSGIERTSFHYCETGTISLHLR